MERSEGVVEYEDWTQVFRSTKTILVKVVELGWHATLTGLPVASLVGVVRPIRDALESRMVMEKLPWDQTAAVAS